MKKLNNLNLLKLVSNLSDNAILSDDEDIYMDEPICGNCELFGTLDCPNIGAINELTNYEFIPCNCFYNVNQK